MSLNQALLGPDGLPVPDRVREAFLAYFRERGHTVVPSAPLVPENDPTLLFTGAGMNPFKDHFLGRVPLEYRRAASSQKCLRTGDLDAVGRTPAHHTFFEMLGNFSFGDYFKKEAVAWAFEFLTVTLGIPRDRLWISVYRDDDEAAGHWTAVAGIPPDRIARLGARSNFWPANAPDDGPDGPCGPCSEIFFDLGFTPSPEGAAVACTVEGCVGSGGSNPASVDCDCRRLIEIWNLVFQQFDRKGANNLVPLAMRNIDTGSGFERLLMVMTHLADEARSGRRSRVYSNFESPLFGPLVAAVGARAARRLDAPADLVAARRIADHARAASFCVADGVRPSNEGRGYVLRRIVRRAVRDGIRLGVDTPFLHDLVPAVASAMGHYRELRDGGADIRAVLIQEEERFRATFAEGSRRLAEATAGLGGSGGVLPGEVAFTLHDTHGFPVDVTRDILREQGARLDEIGFERAMERARERSRAGSKMAGDVFAAGPLARLKAKGEPPTTFLGYGPRPENPDGSYDWDPGVEGAGEIVELLQGERPADALAAGDEGAVVLRATPFYAEQGGQVGDAGELRTPTGVFRVRDTRRVEGWHLHLGSVASGRIAAGQRAEARVDGERRDAVRRNHTATHLLHRVLKAVLGEEARQAGSLVAPDYLRFDFSFPRGLSPEERERIEDEVNRRVYANHPVRTAVHDVEAARATGAVSMFGEKYGDRVRVLSAGDSKEFCGGTHCRATGDIGSLRIVSERSVGSGVRRIEAVTGARAVAGFQEERRRAAALEEEVERLKKELARAVKRAAAAPAAAPGVAKAGAAPVDPLAAPRREGGKVPFVVVVLEGADDAALTAAAVRVKGDGGPPLAALVVLPSASGISLAAAANPAAVAAGFAAGPAVQAAAKAVGGGGGGRADFARGKGKDGGGADAAAAAFEAFLRGA
jgi:alanyl-tRNA synthetase